MLRRRKHWSFLTFFEPLWFLKYCLRPFCPVFCYVGPGNLGNVQQTEAQEKGFSSLWESVTYQTERSSHPHDDTQWLRPQQSNTPTVDRKEKATAIRTTFKVICYQGPPYQLHSMLWQLWYLCPGSWLVNVDAQLWLLQYNPMHETVQNMLYAIYWKVLKKVFCAETSGVVYCHDINIIYVV